MDSLAIAKAYQKIIARFIVNERKITSSLRGPVVNIPVESSRRFIVGEKVVVINTQTQKAEIVTICEIPNYKSIVIDRPLTQRYPANTSVIRKILGYESGIEQYIQGIYLGSPAVISHYPAITIDVKGRSSEWITLESTKETYDIEIRVIVSGGDYELRYEMMHLYADQIEKALFRSFYPLVEPYWEFPLVSEVKEGDLLFHINKENLFCGAQIFFESVDHLVSNRVMEYLGNGVYRVAIPIGRDFAVGDKIIIPRRHIFNTLAQQTQYGVIAKGMLNAAMISLKCEEEVRRHYPYFDPLTT